LKEETAMKGIKFGAAILLVILFILPGHVSGKEERMKTVDYVDINKYMGKWYSIASIPQTFDRQCVAGTTAEYSLLGDGTVEVINSCLKKDGSLSRAKGRAWVVDENTNAKLKVSFFLSSLKLDFLSGDYWVIDLGPDYEYAVVGHPSREYGWILSRTPELPEETLAGIIQRLEAQGYDFSAFNMVDHK